MQLSGFEPYLDQHDIAPGENWEARLGRLIEAADTVVFVISPDAVASERCAWEVERTVTLKKRLLPIVWRRVDEAQVPARLNQLNYIFFDKPLMSVPALTALSTALRTDLSWIREHTRIGEAALRWNGRGRNEALLFRADELAAAKVWLASPPQYAPEPTLLHHEFIGAGEDADAARSTAERRRLDQMATAQGEREKALNDLAAAVRRGQRALAGAAGLFACVVVGALGWYNQAFFQEQYYWLFKMRPSVLTTEEERAKAANPGPETTFAECANGCPTMVVIPAGKFVMGSPQGEGDLDERPQHEVTIDKPFAVSRTEITFAQWDACVAAAECPRVSDNHWGRGDRPVILVSWHEAKQYVAWLSRLTGKEYRLLSEAEREYAARARSPGRWSFGDNEGEISDHAWYSENADNKTQVVGKKRPNAFGLYDMHGNVWEWVEDCWNNSYADKPDELKQSGGAWRAGNCGQRILRGGAWVSGPSNLRSAFRSSVNADNRNRDIGFRVGRTLTP